MSFPETDVFTNFVSRIFRIEDVTSEDPRKGFFLRYRGELLSEESADAYDQLAESLAPYNAMPLFRIEDGRQVIYIAPKQPEPKKDKISTNIILFVLTVLSVMLAGAQPEGPIPADTVGQMLMLAKSIFTGWPFALSLLGILLTHEFGHYFMSRYHKTPATLPYFIPLPFSLIGTMGAAIIMRATPKNKRVLFDIGVAGPIAGLIVAIPVLFYGLSLSTLGTIDPSPGGFLEGNSLLYLFAKFFTFGKLLPAPVEPQGILYWLRYFFTGGPVPFGGTDVFIHPVAFAGWIGILVTGLNLIPAGTLDGGHVVYGLFGDKARKAFPFIIGILIVLGFFWNGWWLWAAILFWLGRVHAQPLDQITTLDPPRRLLAVAMIVVFILVFMPVPFHDIGAMKKIISILFITSIILSACNQSVTSTAEAAATKQQSESGSKTPEPESTVEVASRLEVKEEALKGLEITVWTPWYGIESSLFDIFVKDFNAQNEWGIVVTAQSQVNFSNLYDTVTASLPTVEKPDLVIALPEHALEWNADGVVTDMTPYVEDPKYGIDSSDIPYVFWNQDVTSDARVAIPAQRSARFLLWNETWANEVGFDSAPISSQDFQKQACGAHQSMLKDDSPQNDFAGGWIVDTEPTTAYAWLLAFQGGIVEGEGYRFLTPNNIDAFKFLRELSESACAWQVTDTDPLIAFANREALLITASLEDLPTVARAFISVNNSDVWKVIPFPDETLVVYGSSYVILKSTNEQQLAAWLFTRWLLDNKQDARWVDATHRFPLRSSTVDLLADYKKTHPQWAQAVELLPQGELQPQMASWRTIKVMLGDGFEHMYRVNVPSGQVAAILAQMESLARDLSQ